MTYYFYEDDHLCIDPASVENLMHVGDVVDVFKSMDVHVTAAYKGKVSGDLIIFNTVSEEFYITTFFYRSEDEHYTFITRKSDDGTYMVEFCPCDVVGRALC